MAETRHLSSGSGKWNEMVANSVESGLSARRDAELGVEVGEMVLEGVVGDDEASGDGGVRKAVDEEGEDLELARSQDARRAAAKHRTCVLMYPESAVESSGRSVGSARGREFWRSYV